MLTDTQLRSLTFQGTQKDYPDRDGMFVRVAVRRKSFMLTILQNGRRTYETLGHYPELTLSKARALAKDRLAAVRLGKTEPVTITFRAALDLYEAHHVPTMRPASQYQATRFLENRFRHFHSRKLVGLTTPEIAAAIDSIVRASERLNASIYLRGFLKWCWRRGPWKPTLLPAMRPPNPLRGRLRSPRGRDG